MRNLWRRLRFRLCRERGVSYSLPLVMIAPIYLIFVLAVFEIAFLLVARMGVSYAAHASSRSAAVWDWVDTSGKYPRLAAWSALAPFAGASESELAAAGSVPSEARDASKQYAAMFRGYNTKPDEPAIQRKFQNVAARTTVVVERTTTHGHPNAVRATVVYRSPIRVPGIARFLSSDRSNKFEVTLTATATMPATRPASESGTFGIMFPGSTIHHTR